MLTRSIKKVLGSYFFLLGNVDSIVFTAGIGENDEFVREAVCEGLEPFGIKVDKKENHTRKPGPASSAHLTAASPSSSFPPMKNWRSLRPRCASWKKARSKIFS